MYDTVCWDCFGSLLNNTDQTDQIMLIDFQLECM